MTAVSASVAELAVPEGWIVDDATVDRLRRVLGRAPAEVGGVIAPGGPLPAGSSYRVHAERLTIEPVVLVEHPGGDISGAVLTRPEVTVTSGRGYVAAPGVPLLVDHGAHAHDPWAALPAVASASSTGRPLFPRRPVVMFLVCEPDAVDARDWVRSIVNGLVRCDIEARIASHEAASGLHLTRPCTPDEASVRALAPDVIVTLDERARAVAPEWCGEARSIVLVDVSIDPSLTAELIPWRIDDNAGRWRARIGQAIDPPELVGLVSRLCAGPQPIPPPREPRIGATPVPAPTSERAQPTIAVAYDADGPTARMSSFLAYARRCGATTATADPATVASSDADVVVLDASLDAERAYSIVDQRGDRKTVVDVVTAAHRDALDVAVRCGYALTASDALRGELSRAGVQARTLPNLTLPARAQVLGAAALLAPDEPPVLGVRLESPDSLPEAVVDALVEVLDARPGVTLTWSGQATTLPAAVAARLADVTDHQDEATDEARWVALLWLGDGQRPAVVGRPVALVEAALMGVPSVFDATTVPEVRDPVVARYACDAPGDARAWADLVGRALDDTSPQIRSRMMQRADALYGVKASATLVSRLVGWLTFVRGDR